MQTSALPARPLRLVLADEDAFRLSLAQTLERSFGHQVVGQTSSGLELVEVARRCDPDVVVFDLHLPHLAALDAIARVFGQKPVAAVAVTADKDPDLLQRARPLVHAYLIKPFDAHQIGPTVEVAHTRFVELRELREENSRLQRSLESRKLIERAKGVLMRRHRWTEADAFRRLQRAAMNRRMAMADLARQILDGKEVDL
jgi:AmiR/NasT family two-component response regulator